MKCWLHLLIPPCALLFQALPIVLIRLLASATYGKQRLLPEVWEWPASLFVIAACAAISILLGGGGVYLLLTRARLRTAIPLIALCCVPALIGGAVYLHATLIFLTLV
ncbi:MAG TPA: hypothetical protein PKI11_12740 [Candidatus Hydrogenedentes bacterium]|nr:hypothetical protein [Candidatus Hydrogenedentota bacterium]